MTEDHIVLMEAVARHFFGEPNPALSNDGELIFGADGARRVDLHSGLYFDDLAHQSGDAIDLIKLKMGFKEASQAYAWAEAQGFWSNGHAINGGAGAPKVDFSTSGTLHGYAWNWRGLGDDEQLELELRKWLVEDLLPETGVGLISGQWGTYKSFTADDLAAAVITATPFINFPIERQGAVLQIVTESQSEVDIRMTAALKARGYTDRRRPFAWVTRSPRLLDKRATEILIAMVKQADAFMRHHFGLPVVLVIIDQLGKACGFTKEGQENDAALGKIILGRLEQASEATGAYFIGVTHFGKRPETGTRGTSVSEDDAGVVLALLGDKQMTGRVENTRLCIRKRKTGEQGIEFAFRTRAVTIAGEETLVLEWMLDPAAAAAATKPKQSWSRGLRLLRQLLMNALVDQGEDIRPFADGPIVRAVKEGPIRDEFFKRYPVVEEKSQAAKDKRRREELRRAVKKATQDGLICSREIGGETYIWLLNPAEPPPQGELPL